MALFFICIALLIAGYFTYGALVDRIFGADPSRPTPAMTMSDGVDYVEIRRQDLPRPAPQHRRPGPDLRPDPRRPLRTVGADLDRHRLDLRRCGP